MLVKIKSKLKGPLTERMYKFLMREAQSQEGRKLFNEEELRLVNQALVSQNLFGIGGTMVPLFEKEFATAYGVPYAVSSTSGTAALHTALGALDLNPGDEVITAPITDMGTIIPILYQQCIPVFADIDHTYNMDPQDIERKITDRTKAIIVVHLFGNPCDMDAVMAIAKKHTIPLIEDCAQAHMTEYKEKYVGTIGDIGCFSFQQAKHMTTGDGGMTITSNKAYYEKMRLFVDKGYARKGWGSRAYLFLAPNYRMNELTAAVGIAQLKKVNTVVKKRQELGDYLTKLISGVDGLKPAPVTADAYSSYWIYPLFVEHVDLEAFVADLKKYDVWAGVGYTGKPIYLCSEALTAKKTFGNSQFPFSPKVTDKVYEYKEGLCPNAEETLKHLVCLYPDETWNKERIEKTAQAIKTCFAHLSGGSVVSSPPSKVADAKVSPPADSVTDKLRIGIIGCGQISYLHLEAYKRNPKVELVAFADIDYEKAQKFCRKLTARAYNSHQEMIEKEKLNGVSICTIPSTHKEIVLDALNAGINVLCEKPLAISAAEAQAMTENAKQKKVILLPAFKFRFFEEVLHAKELIEKGGLGNILNFRLMFGGYADMAGTWFAKKELSGGGVIIDNGSHAIDLVRYLLGDIKSVSGQAKNSQDITVEDTARLNLTLNNGATGTIDLSWSTAVPAKNYLEIYGENGTILLDLHGITYKFKDWSDWKTVLNRLDMQESFGRQINHFVDTINGGKTPKVEDQDGLVSQIVIEAAYESIKHGKSISI